jgi:hypothetical protein
LVWAVSCRAEDPLKVRLCPALLFTLFVFPVRFTAILIITIAVRVIIVCNCFVVMAFDA